MKKLLCAFLMTAIFSGSACAEVFGVLSRLNGSPEDILNTISDEHSEMTRSTRDITCMFYDSMNSMFMALQAGEIDTMLLPECVADYVLKMNQYTEAKGFLRTNGLMNLVMGLKEGSEPLRDKISSAIMDMLQDNTLPFLIKHYILGAEAIDPKPVEFDNFDEAETLRVALTGDLPPIDYVDAGGHAAGYNTAMLAELGRRLHMNIKLVYTETHSRAAALISGKADVVLWFEVYAGGKQLDIPEGVITTAPYYGWNKMIWVGMKK